MNFIVPPEIEQPNIAYNPTIQIPPHAIQKSHILSVKEFFLRSFSFLSKCSHLIKFLPERVCLCHQQYVSCMSPCIPTPFSSFTLDTACYRYFHIYTHSASYKCGPAHIYFTDSVGRLGRQRANRQI